MGISGFFGQSFINKNCNNSRTSHDTDMKLGAISKLDKRNKSTSKLFENDFMAANYDVIVFFQFMAVTRKPYSKMHGF